MTNDTEPAQSAEKEAVEALAGVIHRSRTDVSLTCTEADPESCWPIARAVVAAGYRSLNPTGQTA